MTIILYSDSNMEKNVEFCIKSLEKKDLTNVKFIYYTLDFDSNLEIKNLTKHRINKDYNFPHIWYYKPELCLKTIELYTDDDYLYVDSDVLFSRRFNFEYVKNNEDYPLAPYGPFPYTCIWLKDLITNEVKEFNESTLMKYFGVNERSMRYVWACLFSFNNKCKDFFEEEISFLKNNYLLKNHVIYFPFGDETAMNVCLWKRNATKNLGFSMLNTHVIDHIKFVESNDITNYGFGENLLPSGEDWQHIIDSKQILFYHGFKELNSTKDAVDFLLEKN